MAENTIPDNGYKVVYLLVEIGSNGSRRTLWKPHGRAYPCRDGSLNLKLDIHPGMTFNIRDPKSKSEQEEAAPEDEDDRTFTCDDCNTLSPDEEAHLLSGGGVVCQTCSEKYKLCDGCDRMFPKNIRTKLCPSCNQRK